MQNASLISPARRVSNTRRQQGAATLLVLILMLLMMVFIVGNSLALHSLKRDLQRLEQVQLRKFGPAASTNAQPAAVRRAAR